MKNAATKLALTICMLGFGACAGTPARTTTLNQVPAVAAQDTTELPGRIVSRDGSVRDVQNGQAAQADADAEPRWIMGPLRMVPAQTAQAQTEATAQ